MMREIRRYEIEVSQGKDTEFYVPGGSVHLSTKYCHEDKVLLFFSVNPSQHTHVERSFRVVFTNEALDLHYWRFCDTLILPSREEWHIYETTQAKGKDYG